MIVSFGPPEGSEWWGVWIKVVEAAVGLGIETDTWNAKP